MSGCNCQGAGTKKGQERKTARKAYEGESASHSRNSVYGGKVCCFEADNCGSNLPDAAAYRGLAGQMRKSRRDSGTKKGEERKTARKAYEGKRKSNPWLQHVAKVRKEVAGQGLSQPQIVQLAKTTYER